MASWLLGQAQLRFPPAAAVGGFILPEHCPERIAQRQEDPKHLDNQQTLQVKVEMHGNA